MAAALEVKLSGPQPVAGPISWKATPPLSNSAYTLKGPDGVIIPAQLDRDGRLWWWQQPLQEGQSVVYSLEAGPAEGAPESVKIRPAGDELLDVRIEGKPFTVLHFTKDDPRPYLYPVIGPTGDPVTRDWPMKDNPAEKGAKRQDHPHHRSVWTAHGDVRLGDAKKGTDYWSENKGHGYQKVRRIARTVSGPVFGQIVADVDWVNAAGHRELSDTRTYTFFRGNADLGYIDYRLVLHFPDGDVTFADTKEGGLLSLRVATSMDEVSGGHMVNSAGQKGMKQCWGKPADWCDYVGTINRKTVGIAVFDAPANFRHPTPWHIRDYGLFTANPFGLSAFAGRKAEEGNHTFKKDQKAEFNYRILIHTGDTTAARVGEHYKLFAEPGKVSTVD